MNNDRHPTCNADLIEAPELHETTRSGRPTWDERGNTVWEWQTSPGIYSREVNTQQLKVLQAAELQLMDNQPGYTSTYTHWKRQYQDRFTPAPRNGTELVMPVTRREKATSGVVDTLLKKLGLPA
ncbi:MAG TPA: hypothetical protein VHL14_00550 [Steroidobacteraceae bacterium]|jgi:hypothetical protein|nr:hypothetical protein [Steroidobacteraceae bacterium]